MFEHAVAMVTGAASGIGPALAEKLSSRRAIVVLGDVQHEDPRGRCAPPCERYREPPWPDRSHAGIGVVGDICELALGHWRAAIDVNLYGVIHGVGAAYPGIVHQGAGHIVNIAFPAGLIPAPGLAPYPARRGAVVSLTHA